MASEPLVGALLRTLAASKSGGRLLELGTGTGIATSVALGCKGCCLHIRLGAASFQVRCVRSSRTVMVVTRNEKAFYNGDGVLTRTPG